jgi:hypothetical protein
MYGFKKVKKSVDSNSFYHPCFTRDNKNDIALIHRKKRSRASKKLEENSAADSLSHPETLPKTTTPVISEPQSQVLAPPPTMLSAPVDNFIPITTPLYTEPTYFFEVRRRPAYCYMVDDYYDHRFMKPVELEEPHPAFYGFLFR